MSLCYRLMLPICAVALLAACGRAGDAAAGYPAPGEMKLVSMERIGGAEIDTANLIRNGDFRQWWAGAPVPNGFTAPADVDSKVNKVQRGESSVMMQTWLPGAGSKDLSQQLRAEAGPLEKDTPYQLSVTASGAAEALVTLSIWTRDEQNQWTVIAPDVLTLQPSLAVKTYTSTFTSPYIGPVVIAASSTPTVAGDHSVAWLEWRLVPAGAAT